MPEQNETLTADELKAKLERARKRRGEIEERLQRLEAKGARIRKWIRKAGERLRRKRRRERQEEGPTAAVKFARTQIGVTEHPYGSNWGLPVETWIKYTGYGEPVPWCGCFAAYAVVHEGGANIPNRIRLGYHGYIISDALYAQNGLKQVRVEDARPGDIVAYDFAHIGVIVGETKDGLVHTIEGNTSNGVSGSQNNGGGVYERRRPISDVAVIARPAY